MLVPEAAEFLRLKPNTIRAWILRRRISFVKLGGRVCIRRTDLERLIRDRVVLAEANSQDAFKTGGTSPPDTVEPSTLATQPTRGGAK